MALQTLDRHARRSDALATRLDRPSKVGKTSQTVARESSLATLIEASSVVEEGSAIISDFDELGKRVLQSALSKERASFAVRCRSTRRATEFATPMRSLLLTLNSGFGGVSATVSPALMLHTYPAMDALVSDLEGFGAGRLWQPTGERTLAIGDSRHIFVSVDAPVMDTAHSLSPNVLLEVVGSHMIDADWFERVVMARCADPALTFVFYGQPGSKNSAFDKAWRTADIKGVI